MEDFDLEETKVCHRKLNANSTYFNQSGQMLIRHISCKGITMEIYIRSLSHL